VIPGRVTVVTVGAYDVPALRAFYESLGWVSRTPDSDEFAAFPLGGAVFTLYRMDLLAEESGSSPPPREAFRGVTLAVNVEREEMVAEAIEAARAAGAEIRAEPVKRDWGGVSAYFADPEGNVWEVAWLPDSTFDERGALVWPY
jgi:uncharacterized glyoxalase superfamily protein PhnB